jgi:hypothetical protein
MFDAYKRECPRCRAHLGDGVLCPACHKLLPRKLSKSRRLIENVGTGVLLAAFAIAFTVPDLRGHLSALRSANAAAQAPAPPPWTGSGNAPAARAWAVSLEPNLIAVCQDAGGRYADPRAVPIQLTQYLPAVERALRRPLTQEALRLSATEDTEVVALFAGSRISAECLRWAYDGLQNCEVYREDLSSPSAASCMVGAVGRALAVAPYTSCAGLAKEDRVRRACAFAAEQARRVAAK